MFETYLLLLYVCSLYGVIIYGNLLLFTWLKQNFNFENAVLFELIYRTIRQIKKKKLYYILAFSFHVNSTQK